jgi:protein-arginine kinase activator protein McsA
MIEDNQGRLVSCLDCGTQYWQVNFNLLQLFVCNNCANKKHSSWRYMRDDFTYFDYKALMSKYLKDQSLISDLKDRIVSLGGRYTNLVDKRDNINE